jgi:hypothetical protein
LGGAVFNSAGDLSLLNCTLAENSEGGIQYYNSRLMLENCILWNDIENIPEIYSRSEGPVAIVGHSCIQGDFPGEGNIDADPLFVDVDGPDDIPGTVDDDLRLRGGSPCIDAGDNSAVPIAGFADFDGNYRFFDDPATVDTGLGAAPIVDMGAFEFGSTAPPLWGDMNCDGVLDGFDVDPFVAALVDPDAYAAAQPHCRAGLADCNGDGLVNGFDIDPFVAILVGVEK